MGTSYEIERLIQLLEKNCHAIEIVSYGLAPNSFGFCYEIFDDIPKKELNEIDSLLDYLNDDDVEFLRAAYL